MKIGPTCAPARSTRKPRPMPGRDRTVIAGPETPQEAADWRGATPWGTSGRGGPPGPASCHGGGVARMTFDLETWAEIADHLGLAVRTAQGYAAREVDPMPTRYRLGRTVASKADVDAWADRNLGARCPHCGKR